LIDLELMNTNLLAKWLVRFNDSSIQGKWKEVLSSKYSLSLHNISPFWKEIIKDKDLIDLGFNKTIGSENSVFFWIDRWYMIVLYIALIIFFILLLLVPAAAFSYDFLHIDFRRQLVGIFLLEWTNLNVEFKSFQLCPSSPDLNIWRWHSFDKFSVHFFYEWLDFGRVISHEYEIVWKSKIPLKIIFFMWLIRKKVLWETSCVFCDQYEDIDHLLFLV
jgi:hypothetical protein